MITFTSISGLILPLAYAEGKKTPQSVKDTFQSVLSHLQFVAATYQVHFSSILICSTT